MSILVSMGSPVSALVRQEAMKQFAPDESELVIADLEATTFPLIANNGERVQLAILHLSKGDLRKFDSELRQAKRDWRDTLVAAGF